jgi:hypothetical protein
VKVCPVSDANPALQLSNNGAGNVAPAPVSPTADAGVTAKIDSARAAAATFNDFEIFIRLFPLISGWYRCGTNTRTTYAGRLNSWLISNKQMAKTR